VVLVWRWNWQENLIVLVNVAAVFIWKIENALSIIHQLTVLMADVMNGLWTIGDSEVKK